MTTIEAKLQDGSILTIEGPDEDGFEYVYLRDAEGEFAEAKLHCGERMRLAFVFEQGPPEPRPHPNYPA